MKKAWEPDASEKFAMEKKDGVVVGKRMMDTYDVQPDIKVVITINGEEKTYDFGTLLMVGLPKDSAKEENGMVHIDGGITIASGNFGPAYAQGVLKALDNFIDNTSQLAIVRKLNSLSRLFKMFKEDDES